VYINATITYFIGGTMGKSDLTQEIANILEIPVSKAEKVVEVVLREIKQGIIDGDLIIRGFGRFTARNKSKRIGRNPKTGKPAEIKPRRVTTFKASKIFKNNLN